MTRRRRRRPRNGYGQTAIGVLIVAVLLFPVYWMLLTSLRSEAAASASPPELLPTGLRLDAYDAAVVNNATITDAILNSVIISVGTMVLTLLLAVPAAYVLARRRVRFVTPMMLVLLVTQLLPGIAVATPLFVLFKRLDLLNSYVGLILADATLTVPFAILVLRPFFLREVVEPAALDGERLLTWSPPGSPYTDLLVELCRRAGAEVEPVETAITGGTGLPELVPLGAVAIVPVRWPRIPGAVRVPLAGDVTLPLVAVRAAGPATPPAARLIDALRS